MTVATPVRIAIKEILMATDFSRGSEAALPYATELARHFGAGLHVIHVLLPGEWEPTADDTTGSFEYKAEEAATRHMKAFLSTTQLGELRCDWLVRRGPDVWEELYRIVQDKAIDLVVLGTHGRGGLHKLLVGSVAEEVFRKAPCPVLTIGPNVAGAPNLVFSNIAFATDLTAESLGHLPFVLGFAEEFGARLVVIHAAEPGAGAADLALRRLRELIPPQENIAHVVESGDPAQVIETAAEAYGCDLILLGAHPSGDAATHLPGAVAHKILLHARCPVLTVHWFKND